MLDDPAVGIDEVELHTTELGTLATIGRTAETILRGVALSAVAHTEGSVNEDLQLDVGHRLMDGAYLVDGEFAGQHHAAEAQVAQPSYLLCRAIISLCRSVERK